VSQLADSQIQSLNRDPSLNWRRHSYPLLVFRQHAIGVLGDGADEMRADGGQTGAVCSYNRVLVGISFNLANQVRAEREH
jgi:hypothetical protein